MIDVDVVAAFADHNIADEAAIFIEDVVGLVDPREDAAGQRAGAECLEKCRQGDGRAFPEMLAQVYVSARRPVMQLRRIDALQTDGDLRFAADHHFRLALLAGLLVDGIGAFHESARKGACRLCRRVRRFLKGEGRRPDDVHNDLGRVGVRGALRPELRQVDHPRDGQNPLRLFHFIAPRVPIASLPPFVVMGKGDALNCRRATLWPPCGRAKSARMRGWPWPRIKQAVRLIGGSRAPRSLTSPRWRPAGCRTARRAAYRSWTRPGRRRCAAARRTWPRARPDRALPSG